MLEESTYRKIVCNAGHSTRAYSAEEPLPRRCPICGQPYDRRYNRPISCYADGSVPEENTEPISEEVQEEISEEVTAEIPVSVPTAVPASMPADISEETPIRPIMGRRGRSLTPLGEVKPDVQPEMIRYVQRDMDIKQLVLYTGGERIQVTEAGGYLGRQENGGEIFAMNPQISRRHAYVRADRFGNLEVRDEKSLNGTFVDDGKGRRRLKPGETVLLEKGATLWLANQILVIEEE